METEILFVNAAERWGVSVLFGLMGLMAAVYGVVGAGVPALACAGLVARVWRRDTLAVEGDEVVVRGIWRTRRIELAGTTWAVIPTYVGVLEPSRRGSTSVRRASPPDSTAIGPAGTS